MKVGPSMPAVSVVVTAFRRDDYLHAALSSALNQSFEDFEIVVFDDAASDSTRQLVESLGDRRLSYRSNPHPLGPAGNHRAAFQQARGEFLAILNHDDRWEPDFLGTLVPPLQRDPNLVLVFCDHQVIDRTGNLMAAETERVTRQWRRDRIAEGVHQKFHHLAIDQSIPLAMGAVFRKSALPPDVPPDEAGPAYDLWLALKLAATNRGALYCRRRLSAWRVHSESLTAGRGLDWATGAAECWRWAAADPTFHHHRTTIRGKLATALTGAAVCSLRAGDPSRARRFAREALQAGARGRALAAIGLSLLPRRAARTVFSRRA